MDLTEAQDALSVEILLAKSAGTSMPLVIQGHVPPLALEGPPRLVRTTVLRDPVERLLSNLCYVYKTRYQSPRALAFLRSCPGYGQGRFTAGDLERWIAQSRHGAPRICCAPDPTSGAGGRGRAATLGLQQRNRRAGGSGEYADKQVNFLSFGHDDGLPDTRRFAGRKNGAGVCLRNNQNTRGQNCRCQNTHYRPSSEQITAKGLRYYWRAV